MSDVTPPAPSESKMSRKNSLPRHCIEDKDRHGNWRIYYRDPTTKKKTRLHERPGTEAFRAELEAAREGTLRISRDGRPVIERAKPVTWRWLCIEYFARSADYLTLSPETKTARRKLLEATFDEPIKPDSERMFRDMPLAAMTARAVRVLRDRKIETRNAANARLKAIRAVYRFAIEDELVSDDPAANVPYFKVATSGHHAWTVEEVRRFAAHHPVGSMPRLALALLIYTGARRSDVIRLGRQHMKDGWLVWPVHKNRRRQPDVAEVPILPPLMEAIEATATGRMTFLITKFGKPYTDKGFGNRFRDWCDEAGLPHCSAHGLRKAAATILVENGATEWHLRAIFRWKDAKMPGHYTAEASRRRLAAEGMALMRLEDLGAKEG